MELNWNIEHYKGDTEEAIAKQFADHLRKRGYSFHNAKSALYFLTNMAGSFTSISFWKNAIENSPRFANPASFPWTLTNATPGFIAREFLIEGPNYTLIDHDLNSNLLLNQYQIDTHVYNLKSSIMIIWDITSFSPLNVSLKYAVVNYEQLEE